MVNFKDFPLEQAIRYYDEFLIKAEIKDVMGRKIIFNEKGKKSLYKEHTAKGLHVIALENYKESRGKRLSWIKPLLMTTREIYRQGELHWETVLYVGVFNIKTSSDTPQEKINKNYFLIITRRKSGAPLEFVTAYYMESQLDLFKHLEKAMPLKSND